MFIMYIVFPLSYYNMHIVLRILSWLYSIFYIMLYILYSAYSFMTYYTLHIMYDRHILGIIYYTLLYIL